MELDKYTAEDLRRKNLVSRIKAGEKELILELWLTLKAQTVRAARKYIEQHKYRYQIDRDDLVNDAFFAMLKMIDKYDPGKHANFSGCYMMELRRSFATTAGFLTAQQRFENGVSSIYEKVDKDDSEGQRTIENTYPDPIDRIEAVNGRLQNERYGMLLETALCELPADEQDILRKRYYQEMTEEECAELLGLTVLEIKRKERKALLAMQYGRTGEALRHAWYGETEPPAQSDSVLTRLATLRQNMEW